MGVHKTVNGAYRYRYAPFLMSTYYVMGRSPLALPLGELSPQVTERVLQPFSNDKINLCTHHENPCRSWGVISLRSRRAFSNWVLSFGMVIGCPLRPRYARPPLPRGEARDARTVHRKVYRSAPFISSANWSLLHRSDLLLCLILSCGFEICNSSPGRHYCRD